MNCNLIQQDLVEYLLHELSEADDRMVHEHLRAGCADCNAELSNLRLAVEALYDADEGEASSLEHRAEIFSMVKMRRAEINSGRATHAIVPATGSAQAIRFPVLLYSLAFAAGLLLALFVSNAQQQPEQVVGTMPASNSREALPQPSRGGAASRPKSAVVFTSLSVLASPRERIWQAVYDPTSRELHFFCQDFEDPPLGTHYVLATVGPAGEPRVWQSLQLGADGKGRAIVEDVSAVEASNATFLLQRIEHDASVPAESVPEDAPRDV